MDRAPHLLRSIAAALLVCGALLFALPAHAQTDGTSATPVAQPPSTMSAPPDPAPPAAVPDTPAPAQDAPAPVVVGPKQASTPAPRHQRTLMQSGDVGLTYTQERSKFAGAQCQCFPLRGATIDVAADLFHGLGVIGSGQGVAVSNLEGSIDIHQVTGLGGLRYSYHLGHNEALAWGRKGSIFIAAMGGYTFATSGLYPTNNNTALTTHASALTYMGGGGINIHAYERVDIRLIEVDYVRTDLPNGGNNQQNTLRAAAGLNIHIGH